MKKIQDDLIANKVFIISALYHHCILMLCVREVKASFNLVHE